MVGPTIISSHVKVNKLLENIGLGFLKWHIFAVNENWLLIKFLEPLGSFCV